MEALSIGRKLGEGANGAVFLVTRRADGLQLALKRVPVERLGTGERKAVMREVTLLSMLHHPNIIGYEDAFSDGGDLCILMEFVAGGTLDDRLHDAGDKNEPLAESFILHVLAQVAAF